MWGAGSFQGFQKPNGVEMLVADSINRLGQPVLHTAGVKNFVDIVVTLIDGGADLTVRDPDTGVRVVYAWGACAKSAEAL